MTENDLHTIVRDHVTSDEPPFLATPDAAIARGRRTVRRRRALTGGLCAAALAAVGAVTVPTYVGSDDGAPHDLAVANTPDHDASQMPQTLDEHARAAFLPTNPGLPDGERTVFDSQGTTLPPEHWDKASGMRVEYPRPGHKLSVQLLHARSEAEGDRAAYCEQELASGYALACEVVEVDGRPVVQITNAVRRGGGGEWFSVTKDKVATTDPEALWFQRTVEDVRSGTLVVTAQESVKAPTLEHAPFSVSLDALTALGTDPDLGMAPPPTYDDGCVWTLVTGSTDAGDQEGCAGQAQRVESK